MALSQRFHQLAISLGAFSIVRSSRFLHVIPTPWRDHKTRDVAVNHLAPYWLVYHRAETLLNIPNLTRSSSVRGYTSTAAS
jgi:hypothetical protein